MTSRTALIPRPLLPQGEGESDIRVEGAAVP
jgi:hypothetical protein